VGEETVVLDLRERVLYGLDERGGHLFSSLDEPRSAGELAARLGAGRPAADETAPAQAVASFLGELLEAGLIEPVATAPAADQPATAAVAAKAASAPGSSAAGAPKRPARLGHAGPRLLWREQLQEITHQMSPTQQIGNPQCIF
jgi:hypothetical protein